MKTFNCLLLSYLLIYLLFSVSSYAQCTTTITTYPYTQSFEGGINDWNQANGDDGDWLTENGTTPTLFTGPNAASDGNDYLYIEAGVFSAVNLSPGESAFLDSPCYALPAATNPTISFDYHMYGAHIGSLEVFISTDNGATYPTSIFSISNQQQTSSNAPWVTQTIDLSAYKGQTIKLRFIGTNGGGSAFSYIYNDIAIDNVIITANPEISISGNGLEITSGDATPDVTDNTYFGDIGVANGTSKTNAFVIENQGNSDLTLTGSPTIQITGTNANDFSVVATPNTTVSAGTNTSFTIKFEPLTGFSGLRNATVTIVNNDTDESSYTFNIQGNATAPTPDIFVSGNTREITNNDLTPTPLDNTYFGFVGVGYSQKREFTIENQGTFTLNLTGTAPTYITSSNPEFTITKNPNSPIAIGNSTTFEITFTPTSIGLKTADITITSEDPDESPYTFRIAGEGITPRTCPSITALPYNEGFESDLGIWEQITGSDEMDWIRRSGATPTIYTGPNTAAEGNVYVHIESDGNFNKSAILESNCFDLTGMDYAQFKMSYHMYGQDTGTLKVQISTNEGNSYTDIPQAILNGEQQGNDFSDWKELILDLSTYANQNVRLRIVGTTLNTQYSDIAIDDISFTNNIPIPEIIIYGNNTEIISGSTTPNVANNTYYGDAGIGNGIGIIRTYIIENIGTGDIFLSGTPTVEITGTDAADFSITAIPTSTTLTKNGGNTSFIIQFMPSAGTPGLRNAMVSIANNDADENPYTFAIQGNAVTPAPEIMIVGNTNEIVNNDLAPSTTDDTFFGVVGFGFTETKSFTIENNGTDNLNLTGTAPSYITSSNPDFTVTINPSNFIEAGNATTFDITYTPTVTGIVFSDITIANDDADENPYIFRIAGEGVPPNPEIAISGNFTEIPNGSTTTTTINGTNFGDVPLNTRIDKQFIVSNTGAGNLNLTGTPYITVSDPTNFFVSVVPSGTLSPLDKSTFLIAFRPTTLGPKIATVTIANNDTDESTYTFNIRGNCINAYAEAPGGVAADLSLWLKSTDGLPYNDGDPVNIWFTQGSGSDATTDYPEQAPTYRDNKIDNVNFNPVVDFTNQFNNVVTDSDYSFDNKNTEYLSGTSGFYTQDIFTVLIPDVSLNSTFGNMDVFCGDEDISDNDIDATGFGFGQYTGRFNGEVICYAIGTVNGYGLADISTGNNYDNVGIINARNNTSASAQELHYNGINIATNQANAAQFKNVNNSRYWIGRSEGWEASTDARIAEIITYTSRKDDTNATDERNKILSYLALKYGITLGLNGTSQDYVDSNGGYIWNTTLNNGYNYDITGIGRDDNSGLYQKQSKSINSQTDAIGETRGLLTIGLTDIYDTNTLNTSTCPDRTFLIWGNNNGDLNATPSNITKDISSGVPGVSTGPKFQVMQRIWKVIEVGGDMPIVKLKIPKNAIRNFVNSGEFLMFISDTPTFDSNTDFRILTPTADGYLETTYDFSGTTYISFGFAPELKIKRSITFDGANDYLQMNDALDLNPSGFTISAWIKADYPALTTAMSILSKRDAAYTDGYEFSINTNKQLEMSWGPSGSNKLTGTTILPSNQWHHVAVIYNPSATGGNTKLYIDGIEEASGNFGSTPTDTNFNSRIACTGSKNNTTLSHFKGTIDEVRIWSTALNVDQLRYIMNQEVQQNGTKIKGSVLPTTITKDNIKTINWDLLQGYYPMNSFSVFYVDDESINRNLGSLRNINTVDRQTAPLPYISENDGSWDDTATWLHGGTQAIPGATSIVNINESIGWNIVKTANNITMNNAGLPAPSAPKNLKTRTLLGLDIESGEINVEKENTTNASDTGSGLEITHYLKLDGKIDLNGEAQLVQTESSDFDPASSGVLERDQQGTSNLYTYNYWSSPVITNSDRSYTISSVLKDGTDPNAIQNIAFTTDKNGANGSPISISDYWIWKYSNQDGQYSSWQHVKATGTIYAGEGYTMKGVDASVGSETDEQNYAFVGQPNNGDIDLTVTAGNMYLVGNPYPSALDSREFILDNTGTTGTIYFWEHWGGGSHLLKDYQGGYAELNLTGATPATSHPDVSSTGNPNMSKTPSRFIPVAQGFVVIGGPTNSTIQFRNTQRNLVKETTGGSIFIRQAQNGDKEKSSQNENPKMRLKFKSPKGYIAEALVGVNSNATMGVDWGYDALEVSQYPENMYWMLENDKYKIQGIDNINKGTILPLGLYTAEDGTGIISIKELLDAPKDLDVYIHDKDTDIYHDLKLGHFEIFLNAGEYNNRFEITFSKTPLLDNEDYNVSSINTYFNNANSSIIIDNPELKQVNAVRLITILGQEVLHRTTKTKAYTTIKAHKLNAGVYTIELLLEDNNTITKKVIIK